MTEERVAVVGGGRRSSLLFLAAIFVLNNYVLLDEKVNEILQEVVILAEVFIPRLLLPG